MRRHISNVFGVGKQNGFKHLVAGIFNRHATIRFFERIIAFVFVMQFKKHRIAIVSIRNQLVAFKFNVLAFPTFVNAGCHYKTQKQTAQNELFHGSKVGNRNRRNHTAIAGFYAFLYPVFPVIKHRIGTENNRVF